MDKLYHYSENEFDILKSLRLQNRASEISTPIKNRKYYPGEYSDSVSFFFEPIPTDIISACFKHEHDFWRSGKILFEHTVSISSLKDFKYHIVESPLKTAIYDNFPELPSMNDVTWDNYLRLSMELQQLAGEIGTDISTFKEIIHFLEGTTREQFSKIRYRKDFNNIKSKYAATVPHVMLYPKTGTVQVESVRKIKIK